ncbi:MAG: TolC family protein [Lacipirellulaceae bacterium]
MLRVVLACAMAAPGCSAKREFVARETPTTTSVADQVAAVNYDQEIAAALDGEPSSDLATATPAPFDLATDATNVAYWELSLDEAIRHALANSTVMRDLGAQLLQSPDTTSTVYDPSLRASDARFGEEAALSAFDAQAATRLFYEKNDRALNNSLLGGGTNFFDQNLGRFQTEVSKRSASGTGFALRHNVEDDFNNAPRNIYGSAGQIHGHAWGWNLEAEVRQPLLAGAGADFNRIAGPDAVAGQYNGLLIARVNTAISVTDFQLALRDYLSNVENAYWELVFAYRDLESKKTARDNSLAAWQRVKELSESGLAGAESDKVAQAAEQYFRFQQDVENALAGRVTDGTRSFNGSTGGTFQGAGGVYVAERRLRLLMGAPINDGRLIRPATEPKPAEVVFAWDQVVASAISRRPETLAQRLRIKRRGMELQASKNFLLPDLDMVGLYRYRGLGDNLYDASVPLSEMGPNVGSGTDEWQMGFEMNVPLGYRRGHAGVRNAELALARERALLGELERQIVHDVSNAVAEQSRLYQNVQTAYNRRSAAVEQYEILNSSVVQESARGRRIDYDLLLDSIRRVSDAEIAYHRAAAEYAVALKNVNLESGNLLTYCNVHFAEREEM